MADGSQGAGAMNLDPVPGAAPVVPLRASGPVEEMKLAAAGLGGAAAGGALPGGAQSGYALVQPAEPAVDPEEVEAAPLSLSKGVAMSAPPEGKFFNAMGRAGNKAVQFLSKYSLRLVGREHDLHPSPLSAQTLQILYDRYQKRAGPIARTTPLRTAAAASPLSIEKEPSFMCSYGNAITFKKLTEEFFRLASPANPLPFLTFWYDVQESEREAGHPDRWHFDLSFFFKTKAFMEYSEAQAAALSPAPRGFAAALASGKKALAPTTDKYFFTIGLSNNEIMLAQSAVRQKPPVPIIGSFAMYVEDVKAVPGGAGGPSYLTSNAGHRVSFILIGTSLILTESWATFEYDYLGDIPAWKVLKIIRQGFGHMLQDWPIYEIYRPCLLQEVGAEGGVRVARYTPNYVPPTQREVAMSSNFQRLETDFSIGAAQGKCAAWGGILSYLSVQRTNLSPGIPVSDVADAIRRLVYDEIESSLVAANSPNKKRNWMASMLGHFYGGGRRKQRKTRGRHSQRHRRSRVKSRR